MTVIRVAGFDPSMNNWGMASGQYNSESQEIQVHGLGVVKPSKQKARRKSETDLGVASQLFAGVDQFLSRWLPHILFVEVPVGSQSARAMASYAMCITALSAIRFYEDRDFISLTPREVKLSATDDPKASKIDMIDWAVGLYPDLDWPRHTVKGEQIITTGSAEHMADAIGAIHAGIELYGDLIHEKLKEFPDETLA